MKYIPYGRRKVNAWGCAQAWIFYKERESFIEFTLVYQREPDEAFPLLLISYTIFACRRR